MSRQRSPPRRSPVVSFRVLGGLGFRFRVCIGLRVEGEGSWLGFRVPPLPPPPGGQGGV